MAGDPERDNGGLGAWPRAVIPRNLVPRGIVVALVMGLWWLSGSTATSLLLGVTLAWFLISLGHTVFHSMSVGQWPDAKSHPAQVPSTGGGGHNRWPDGHPYARPKKDDRC